MKTIKIIIERRADMYNSYAENVEGIYGWRYSSRSETIHFGFSLTLL